MARPKGGQNKYYTQEEKIKVVKEKIERNLSQVEAEKIFNINQSVLGRWRKDYLEKGEKSLINQKNPGNPLLKYSKRKTLTDIEKLEYENMKLRIENERLKKGYLVKGDGSVVVFKK